jgi:hypothetical protein
MSPSIFAKHILKMPLYPGQQQIVDAFTRGDSRVTVRTCNESGKTTRLIACLILWHMSVFPRKSGSGGVITTSGSWNQVKNQLVPALRSYAHLPQFQHYEFNADSITLNGFPQWVGFATNNPGAAEGFHGGPDAPLLVIEDEAKTVPDQVNQALADRCNPQRIGLFSSPGPAEGHFYRSHSDETGWTRFKIPASQCPHISQDSIQRRIARHGLDSPLVRSMIFADFMERVEGGLVTLSDLELCLDNPPAFQGDDRRCFCDFAAGGDENVIAFRQGNRVRIVDAWTDLNTMSAVGRFVTRFNGLRRSNGLMPQEIEGDADGVGKPMIDRLHEAGWPIGYFHGGSRPRFDTHFSNLISEVWFTGADRIKNRSIIIEPDDLLRSQLINRKSSWNSRGQSCLETKDEMKRRGVPSPDRADALFGAISPGIRYTPYNLVESHRQDDVALPDPDWPGYTPSSGDDYFVPGTFVS